MALGSSPVNTGPLKAVCVGASPSRAMRYQLTNITRVTIYDENNNWDPFEEILGVLILEINFNFKRRIIVGQIIF